MNKFLKESWSCIIFDKQLNIIEIIHPNNKLFFDTQISPGTTNGDISYFNNKTSEMFEGNRDEILKNPINILNNPTIPIEIKDAIRNMQPIQIRFPYDFDSITEINYYKTSKTSVHQIECNGRPIINSSGEFDSYVLIIENITEATLKEEALRQSNSKIEIAMRAADIMFWEFDAQTQTFICDNEPLNGYDRTKHLKISDYTDSIHPDDLPKVEEPLKIMINGEDRSFHFDARIKLPGRIDWQYCSADGSPYQKDSNGKVTKYVGSRKNNTELQKRKILQDKILNNIPLPILIKNLDNNLPYVFCNEESKRVFGVSEEQNTYNVIDEKQAVRIEKTDKEVFTTGQPYLGLERIALKDGRTYDMIVRKSIFEDDGKRLLLNVRWDQSLQNDLQRRAKVLSISMEAMNAYTWFFEPSKGIVSFGEGFDKLGKDAEEVNTLEKFIASIHPDDKELFTTTIGDLLESNSGNWDVEYRIDLDGNGTYQWWKTRGVLETSIINDSPYKYMIGMSINIDMHKQSELTLLKNREELKQLVKQNEQVLNNTNSGLAYITSDYIVQWENVSGCSASLSYEAYKRGELCYKSAHNRTTPCENCVLQRAKISRQVEQIKFCLNNKRTVEVFATPVINDDNLVEGVVVRIDDITERESMIEELRNAKIQAEQSDKLKSAFLANMSHEIRTPLNAIVGFSDLLMNVEDPEEKAEYIKIINNNNELLIKLISDILDLSKIEAGSVDLKYERFDMSQYFDEIATAMEQRLNNPKVRLVATNPYQECFVSLDKNRVAQIMTNYVTNSIKYTKEGSIEMGYEHVPGGIKLWVKDTGIGISEDKLNKVFHRFAKLDEFAQGTGLGLSICKAIVESMKGRVGFESKEGEGSLFWAILPCSIETRSVNESIATDKDNSKNNESNKIEININRKTILVAEDIDSNYMLLLAMLRNSYNMLRAKNGLEAVEAVKNNKVDLVLMDMKMPVMNGLDATEEIRKFNTELPILALTAHAFDSDRQAALKAGCNDYLVKPINRMTLLTALTQYGCTESSNL